MKAIILTLLPLAVGLVASNLVNGSLPSIVMPTALIAQSEFCFKVPFAKPSTCSRDVTTQEAYRCAGVDEFEKCSVVSEVVEQTCYRNVSRRETYDCMKDEMTEECQMRPVVKNKQCYREVRTPSPCALLKQTGLHKKVGESCRLLTSSAPDTCTRLSKKVEEYSCIKTEAHKICKPEAIKTKTIDDLCKRTVMPSLHDCQRKKRCLKTNKLCKRNVAETRVFPCKSRPTTCIFKDQEVDDICTKSVQVRESYPCPLKSRLQKECPEVSVDTPSICTRKKTRREEYECDGESFYNSTHLRLKTPWIKGVKRCMREIPILETYPCTKSLMIKKCLLSKVDVVHETCYRTVMRDEEYPCKSTKEVRHCQMEDNTSGELCEEEQTRTEEYTCDSYDGRCLREDEEDEEYEGCIRAGAIEERYPCPLVGQKKETNCSIQFVPVETTCVKTLPWVDEFECSRMVKERVCQSLTAKPSCLKSGLEVVKKESYNCATVEYVTQCEQIAKRVSATCHIDVPVVEPYTCSKAVQRANCIMETRPKRDTCYRNVVKTEQYKCFQLSHKKQCKKYPAGVSLKSAAKSVQKDLKKKDIKKDSIKTDTLKINKDGPLIGGAFDGPVIASLSRKKALPGVSKPLDFKRPKKITFA